MRARSPWVLSLVFLAACANGTDDSAGLTVPPFDAGADASLDGTAPADTGVSSDAPEDDAADASPDVLDDAIVDAIDDASTDASTDSGAPGDSGAFGDSAADTGAADSGPFDSGLASDSSADASDAIFSPYRHTIVIDGTNDFLAGERFVTTSAGYDAYVAWDATHLFVGYDGGDVNTALAPDQKWLFFYLDVGGASAPSAGETYNTETPGYPTGYHATYYVGWRGDDKMLVVRHYAGAWSDATTVATTHARGGTFVEFSVPLASLGSPASIGVESFLMNVQSLHEATYAGLYAGNFTDGPYTTVPLTKYLLADFSLASAPNDPSRARP